MLCLFLALSSKSNVLITKSSVFGKKASSQEIVNFIDNNDIPVTRINYISPYVDTETVLDDSSNPTEIECRFDGGYECFITINGEEYYIGMTENKPVVTGKSYYLYR